MGAHRTFELLSLQVPAALRAEKGCSGPNRDGPQIPAGKSRPRRLPVPECIVPYQRTLGFVVIRAAIASIHSPSERTYIPQIAYWKIDRFIKNHGRETER